MSLRSSGKFRDAALTAAAWPWEGKAPAFLPTGAVPLTRTEIWRIEKYLRNLFRLDTITLLERPRQQDSVEVHVAGEFIGVIFRDDEEGEVSYSFNMAILEMDLPEPPPSRA